MRQFPFIFLFAVITIFSSFSQKESQWRGPNRDGIYPETGLLKVWPANGSEILWTFDGLGQGHSSPVFVNNKIYITGMLDTIGYIFELSEEGKLLKKYPYGVEWYLNFNGTRSTPVIIDNLLYILSGQGVLSCIDVNTQKDVWKKDLFKEFDGKNINWGITENLVIDGDVIYCAPGGKQFNVIALNRLTGGLIWSTPGEGELSAYHSPLLIQLPERKLLVTMMASHILGIDAGTGKMLWSYPQPNRWSVHANTPIYHNGEIYCFSGYGQGGVKLKLNDNGSSVTKQWFNNSNDSRMGGAVLIDGCIYASGDNNRKWFCIDWNTGENKYEFSDLGIGVIIAADGMLYCYSQKGELALVKVDPAKFEIVSQTKVALGTEQHWAHPVINKGRLFVRHGNTLIAYKIK